MADTLSRRIMKETERLDKDPGWCSGAQIRLIAPSAFSSFCTFVHLFAVPGIVAVPHVDNLRYFDVAVNGPKDTPFEGKSEFFSRLPVSFAYACPRCRRCIQT